MFINMGVKPDASWLKPHVSNYTFREPQVITMTCNWSIISLI